MLLPPMVNAKQSPTTHLLTLILAGQEDNGGSEGDQGSEIKFEDFNTWEEWVAALKASGGKYLQHSGQGIAISFARLYVFQCGSIVQ